MTTLAKFLDIIPLNGYKSYLGIAAAALVLGLQQLGLLDAQIAETLLTFVIIPFTGISIVHKDLKKVAQ